MISEVSYLCPELSLALLPFSLQHLDGCHCPIVEGSPKHQTKSTISDHIALDESFCGLLQLLVSENLPSPMPDLHGKPQLPPLNATPNIWIQMG